MLSSHFGPELRESLSSSAALTSMRSSCCSPNPPAASWLADLEPELMHVSVHSQKTISLSEYSNKLVREFLGDELVLLPEY